MKPTATNITRLRRDAYDCRYSHMVMEPTQIMDLCDEIFKLRNKVTELGGDPFDLAPLPAPAGLSVEETKQALGADSAVPVGEILTDPLSVAQIASIAGYGESADDQPKEPPQPAATEESPTHTDDTEQQ